MKKVEKFFKEIDFVPSPNFLNGKLVEYKIDNSDEKISIYLKFQFENFLNIEEVKGFELAKSKYKRKIFSNYFIINKNYDVETIYNYLLFTLQDFKNPIVNGFIKTQISFDKATLKIKAYDKSSEKFWNLKKIKILERLNNFGFNFDDILINLASSNEIDFESKENTKIINQQYESKERQKEETQLIQIQSKGFSGAKKNIDILEVDKINNETVISHERKTVKVIAEIISEPETTTVGVKNLEIINILLTNHKDTINSTIFINTNPKLSTTNWEKQRDKNNSDLRKKITDLKKGDAIIAIGTLKINNRSGEIYLQLSDFAVIKNPFVTTDKSERKRIEFNFHTKMSSQDGISDVTEYIETAIKWGHKAIAITDINSIQSYPEAHNKIISNKSDLKIIWGLEANVFYWDKILAIFNEEKIVNLEKDTFIFFDLETTGLSSYYDEIIEFGALKVKEGKVIDKKQIFIKPDNPIPPHITEITKIDNDMVKDAPNIKQVAEELKTWIGNSILVAHNSDFDVPFLKQLWSNMKWKKMDNPIIDTLKLSWAINEKFTNHRLGTIAKKYGINYSSTVAHRADYDAEILYEIYQIMEEKLKYEKNYNVKYINSLSKNYLNKIFTKSITIYAKNQTGLKDLYELISLAHSKYLGRVPLLPFDEIEKRRKNLLIGSGSDNGELFDLIINNRNDIDSYIKRYDFLQLQPEDSLSHLIDNNRVSAKNLRQALIDIYALGKKHKKIVIASGNVFYSNPYEKKIREVLVNNKGLGGVLHYLFNFKNKLKSLPDNYFRTTKTMKNSIQKIFKDEQIVDELVIDNPEKLSEQFEYIKPIPDNLYTPKIYDNPEEKLKKLIYKNGVNQYGPIKQWNIELKSRVEKEFNSIIKHGYAEFYLISSDIVRDSNSHGYLVGSRGSVGSSIVATLSEITEVNPLEAHYYCGECHYFEFGKNHSCGYDLKAKKCPNCKNIYLIREGHGIPFETFLGFEGDKIPDIDLNFAREYQASAHNFARKLFGEENIFRAGTISTLASKTAYGFIKNWEEGSDLKLSNGEIKRLEKSLVGSKRTTGQHPGGLIVVPKNKSIYDFTPTNFPANDKSEHKTTHFDFHAIHNNLLKLDLLGHLDPSVLKYLGDLTGVDPKSIPTSDKKVMNLFISTEPLGIKKDDVFAFNNGAIGIPEFGTKFIREMLDDAKPSTFADLVRISGLSHGTDVWYNNAKDLIKNKIINLKETISCRDDIMTYLISKGINPLVAFNIMENIRKGRGLKIEEENEMRRNGIEDWYIKSANNIKYLFPKAHAVAYVLNAWRVAWYKVYYPLQYYSAYFSKRFTHFDYESLINGKSTILKKLKEYNERDNKKNHELGRLNEKEQGIYLSLESAFEMYSRGLKISKLDINRSLASEWIIDKKNNSLIPPFLIIPGLGDISANKLVKKRESLPNKKFVTKEEFLEDNLINKTVLKVLEDLKLFEDIRDSSQMSIFDY